MKFCGGFRLRSPKAVLQGELKRVWQPELDVPGGGARDIHFEIRNLSAKSLDLLFERQGPLGMAAVPGFRYLAPKLFELAFQAGGLFGLPPQPLHLPAQAGDAV